MNTTIDTPDGIDRDTIAGSRHCPACGTTITGITTDGPGIHRFANCGHPASGRSVNGSEPSMVSLTVE